MSIGYVRKLWREFPEEAIVDGELSEAAIIQRLTESFGVTWRWEVEVHPSSKGNIVIGRITAGTVTRCGVGSSGDVAKAEAAALRGAALKFGIGLYREPGWIATQPEEVPDSPQRGADHSNNPKSRVASSEMSGEEVNPPQGGVSLRRSESRASSPAPGSHPPAAPNKGKVTNKQVAAIGRILEQIGAPGKWDTGLVPYVQEWAAAEGYDGISNWKALNKEALDNFIDWMNSRLAMEAEGVADA